VIYRNAQGNIPTLTQIVNYFISENVTLIGTCPSIATITAIQNTQTIPVFMTVSPTPERMQVITKQGEVPKNLLGVGDDIDYIDTAFLLIPKLIKPKGKNIRVGMIFNQSEPQSVDAIRRIEELAKANSIELVSLPVNATTEVQLVTGSLLSKDVDVFFANPDNTVFASFETIVQSCNDQKVPIITSEAGLVDRGALAAYGADMYQWGYQTGQQAATLLRTGSTQGLQWQLVKVRKRVYNPEVASRFGFTMPADYQSIR
jgi:putative ABC transport system substrate-binding protein